MIGKMRQVRGPEARAAPRRHAAFGQGCGILRHGAAPGAYRHERYPAPIALAEWIEYFWVEEWHFSAAAAQTRAVLPHPNVQLVFAANRSRAYGVQCGRFERQLVGDDRILGVKFRPGAFYPWLRKPVSSLVNAALPLAALLAHAHDVERAVLAGRDDACMIQTAAEILLARRPPPDANVEHAARWVEHIAAERGITRVEHLAAHGGIQPRTLQRLFNRYVGASPRWAIKRYRIYEALEQVSAGTAASWAALAQDLGYFDQAHFANEFRRLVGCSPGEYVRPAAE